MCMLEEISKNISECETAFPTIHLDMCEEPICSKHVCTYEKPVHDMPHVSSKLNPCVASRLFSNPSVSSDV